MSEDNGYMGYRIYRTANPTPVRTWDYAAYLWDDPESGIEFMGASVDAVKRNIDFELIHDLYGPEPEDSIESSKARIDYLESYNTLLLADIDRAHDQIAFLNDKLSGKE